MKNRILYVRWSLAVVILSMLGHAFAFSWEMGVFPPGDQGYTFEMRLADGSVVTMDVDIKDNDGNFTVNTVIRNEQQNVSRDDLASASMGNAGLAMIGLGPMFMFGSAGFMLPMIMGNEDIAVSDEAIRIMGIGRLSMPRSITVDGHECVVLQIEPNESEEIIEFALAENVPFPCYSSIGEGEDKIEFRLIRIER